jgi:toxin ParE1/3/4
LRLDYVAGPFERYVVFYLPMSDGIDIVRVLHSARDIEAIFGDNASH